MATDDTYVPPRPRLHAPAPAGRTRLAAAVHVRVTSPGMLANAGPETPKPNQQARTQRVRPAGLQNALWRGALMARQVVTFA